MSLPQFRRHGILLEIHKACCAALLCRLAKAWATFFSLLVFVSTFLVLLESLPRCQLKSNHLCDTLPTIHTVLTGTFILELLFRFSCFPSIKQCLLDYFTWVDIVALAPDLVELVRSHARSKRKHCIGHPRCCKEHVANPTALAHCSYLLLFRCSMKRSQGLRSCG